MPTCWADCPNPPTTTALVAGERVPACQAHAGTWRPLVPPSVVIDHLRRELDRQLGGER